MGKSPLQGATFYHNSAGARAPMSGVHVRGNGLVRACDRVLARRRRIA
jgi:hypothetical protein